MQRQRFLPLAGAVLALAACGSKSPTSNNTNNIPDQPTGTPVQAATVEVRDDRYVPTSPLISAGGTVTWTWTGVNGHSVTSDGTPTFSPNAPVRNAPFTLGPVVFAAPGTYSFHCSVHGVAGTYGSGTMTGAVFVQ